MGHPAVVQRVGRISQVRGFRAVDHLLASLAVGPVVPWFPFRLPHAAARGGEVGIAIIRRLVARAADPPFGDMSFNTRAREGRDAR